MAPERRLAAIMFTDLEGFTSDSHDDESSALRLLERQEAILTPIVSAHRGRAIKSMGDGLLLEFPNARDAVECAVAIQQSVHEHNALDSARPLRLRVGIHLGDVEGRGADILGDAVNIASRVEPLAEPGGVCLSAQVYDQVHNKVPYQLESLGSRNLKGIREPVEVYRVLLPWAAAAIPMKTSEAPRLAVLPLANISPDPKDEYFADGLTDELISLLSQIRTFRVIARTSILPYKSAPKSLIQIGKELRVDAVLEGTVRKAGDQLRITVQLVDPRTEEQRWVKTFDRTLDNVFAIQREVAEQTAAALQVELIRGERESIGTPPTSSLEAYTSYLQGIHASLQGTTGGCKRAVAFLDRAIQVDPRFVPAHTYLANLLLDFAEIAWPSEEVMSRADRAVTEALDLAPTSPEAHAARGNYELQMKHDWHAAEVEFERAIALGPGTARAHDRYGLLLEVTQRYTEAREQLRLASELDPASTWIDWHRALVEQLSGNFDSAVRVAQACLARLPDAIRPHVSLAASYLALGKGEEALDEADIAVQRATERDEPVPDRPLAQLWRAWVGNQLGKDDAARRLALEWEAERGPTYISPNRRAGVLATIGRREEALEVLELDLRRGCSSLWHDYQAPYFDPIREEPRFVALLQALNLPLSHRWPRRASGSAVER